VTALNEVGLIASREIRKNLRSVKGLVMVILSLLGAIAVALLLVKLRKFNEMDMSAEQLRAGQEFVLSKKYDDEQLGKYLAGAPAVLTSLMFMTIWLSPLLVAALGFDGISGELQHRSVRYWMVRARRGSYFAGKVIGLWTVVAAITLVMHVLIWIVTLIQGGTGTAGASETLSWGVHFYLVTLPISAAWCGIATLISSRCRSPIFAIFVTSAIFAALWVVYIVGEVAQVKALTFLYPNSYDAWLLSPRIDRVALGAFVCFAISAFTTGLGTFFFTRSDV